jgi:hypothetical protein
MSIWVTMKHWRCTYIAVAQNALLNWEMKPWSTRRTRKSHDLQVRLHCQEPLSVQAVSSRQVEGDPVDAAIFVQTSVWKHDVSPNQDTILTGAFTEGQGLPNDLLPSDPMSDTEQRGSDQSPSSSTSPSDVHPPASAGDRQEAILFHLQDDPIRTMAVTTWYVHHDCRPICNRPRHLIAGKSDHLDI